MEKKILYPQKYEDRELNLEIDYSFRSSLGSVENYRYRQEIFGKIIETDETGEPIKEMGYIHAYKLLLGVARNEGWNLEAVFDTEDELEELGKKICNYKKDDWKDSVNELLMNDTYESDVLVLSEISILPEYRGLDIGAHAIKDLFNNFIQGCSFMVLDCTPPQFIRNVVKEGFYEQMRYDLFTDDKETAYYKLLAYFQRIGFHLLPGFSSTLMFLSSMHENEKFDQINLD